MTKQSLARKQAEAHRKIANRGIAQRTEDYKTTLRETRDHRAAVRAYCAGNVWLEANARAVGNW